MLENRMVEIVVILAAAIIALVLFGRTREWLLEELKAFSDRGVVFVLRFTSGFGDELTEEGKAEQGLWREQRLRNLRGLALRAKQRWSQKVSEP